ncbi:hypothetical protein A2Z00_02710 [Candidatus Gottesmanbacteria bacterium RBG_13_45_10]|uniref:Adenosine monophosphate-protein transferase n=1 Tax=Candidatus Gottesmanbacteria bacterium RBG_13_45_10 TaxID=1798370 RepID=A0A1F5ZHD6_9BACT|nr:MAG: hypothetical protein A2Z00_02710 [Candidatus Gottesmanbacteria bacterium RBG_13_45_10]
MRLLSVRVHNPAAKNFIFGQTHFIKSVEDLHEALACAVPGIKFGIAFCEASGDRLIRNSGTSDAMIKLATENAKKVGAGHTFFIFLDNAFPINVLNAVKMVPEVCHIFCATANACDVIVAETKLGGGVLGVIDGQSPKGVESKEDVAKRKEFLRAIGYKL